MGDDAEGRMGSMERRGSVRRTDPPECMNDRAGTMDPSSRVGDVRSKLKALTNDLTILESKVAERKGRTLGLVLTGERQLEEGLLDRNPLL